MTCGFVATTVSLCEPYLEPGVAIGNGCPARFKPQAEKEAPWGRTG
jgi:hypothetical protein